VSIIKVGLCGHGYWGQNLLRTFSGDPKFEVVAVSDIRESARDRVRRTNTAIRLYGDGTEVIDDPEVEAVAIATPAATHFSLARRALVRDKHVLVEKPMCASVAEAKELVALAEVKDVTLMVATTPIFFTARSASCANCIRTARSARFPIMIPSGSISASSSRTSTCCGI
jgi:predicted dehydrogenase